MRICGYIIAFFFFSFLSSEGISQKNELTLQLKWWHQFQFAGYYAAVKQGYYEKQGLHVTLVPGDAKQIVTQEVLAGRAVFGITGSDLLINYAKGQPLVALGAIFQHSPYVIMSLPQEHINAPSDLVGKTIMASENQEWVELKAVFLKEGIDLKKLSVVNHNWQNIDLIKGRVDAMTGYRSVEPYQLKQLGLQTSLILPINYGIDFYSDILFTSRSYLEKNPELVEKFRQASFLGWEYAMNHKDEICDYILTLPGVAKRNVTKAALLFEADEMEKLILPQLIEIGHMNKGRWNHILEIHQELGLIPQNTNLDKFIYQKKPSIYDSLKNIGVLVLGSITLLFLLVVMYGFMVRKAVKRKTQEQRKAMEALSISEEKYRTLVEQASDGIVICTPDLRFIQANSAALKILGYTAEEFYQLQLTDILVLDGQESPLKIQELNQQQSLLTQRLAKRKDESKFVVEIHSSMLSSGNFLGFLRDITEQKNQQDTLQLMNTNLGKANKDLALSNQELEQFAYVASHDLQEPLRMVTSFLTQLDKKYHHQLDEKAHQYIHFAVDGARRMRQIILELLEFSRVGRHNTEKEQINLNDLIEEVKVLQKKSIDEKKAEITADHLPVIFSFKIPLLQIFQNLISNAIKYSKQNSPPVIHIHVEDTKDYWTFSIQDNGIGINHEYFDKIFIIFQRLHTKDEYSGSGMGLAIVKKIIDNMGGSIRVESEPETGSTFIFTIPK